MRPIRRRLTPFLASIACILAPDSHDTHAAEHYVTSREMMDTAIASARPGDDIVLRSGVWRDVEIEFEGEGTAAAPITLRAEEPGQTILTGQSSLAIGGRHLVVSGLLFTQGWLEEIDHIIQFRRGSNHAEDCRVTQCAIVNYNPPSRDRRYFWGSLYGHRNRVDHCYFSGMNHSGVMLVVWLDGTVNDHLIDHNHFARHRSGRGENGWETMRIGTSEFSLENSRTTVESNLFEECAGEIETISNKSCENIYRANTFLRTRGMLTLRHGRRCLVDGNFFLGQGLPETGGIRVIGEDHVITNNYIERTMGRDGAAITIYAGQSSPELSGYFPADRALVAFNTIIGVDGPAIEYARGLGGSGRTVEPVGVVVANNILAAAGVSSGGFLSGSDNAPANVTWTGNIAFGRPLGFEIPTGAAVVDPLLARGADNLFRPSAGSPAVDAAEDDFSDITADMDGQPRTSPKDVGADELSTAEPQARPLTAADVGPQWLADDRRLDLGRLVNLSVRGYAGAQGERLIAGCVASEALSLLARAVGPGLADFGVANAMADPRLILYQDGAVVADNGDWFVPDAELVSAASLERGAFGLIAESLDSALLYDSTAGTLTVHATAESGEAGTVLLELYTPPVAAGEPFTNASGRAQVQGSSQPLILGFVLQGTAGRTVLVRAVGPGLAELGVSNVLLRPTLRLYHGSALIAENSGWETVVDPTILEDAAAQTGAFALESGSDDCALLSNLPAGAYTVVVSGLESAGGSALAELYLMPEN